MNLDSNMYLIILVSSVLIIQNLRLTANTRFKVFVYYCLGGFFHELAHFIVSLCTNGKPVKFSIIPQRSENGWTVGYVKSMNLKWYNTFLISFAPVLLLPLVYYWSVYFFDYVDATYLNYFIYYFVLVNLISSAIPSPVDLHLALNSVINIALFILLSMCLILGLLYLSNQGDLHLWF